MCHYFQNNCFVDFFLWFYKSIVFSNSSGVVNDASHTKKPELSPKEESSTSQKQSCGGVRCNTTLGSCKAATTTPAGPSVAVSAAFVFSARQDSSLACPSELTP